MQRGEVTLETITLEVLPFDWPVALLRIGIHETATGRLVERDTTTRVQDVDLALEGNEETGWARMNEATKALIEAQYQAGAQVTITDWRGNTGEFFYSAPPEFRPVAAEVAVPLDSYWAFRLQFIRVS